jgi:uncharacterized protein YdiU (UPF0061 family)
MNAQQPIKPPIPDPFRLSMEPGYHALGEGFFTQLQPERVTDDPVLVHASASAAALIGLPSAAFDHPDAAAVL